MHSARPAATTVVTRPTSSSPGSTRYQPVSAMRLHPHPSLAQELNGLASWIGRAFQLRPAQRRSLERRIVEVLGPDADDRRVVCNCRICTKRLQRVGGEGVPVSEGGGGGGLDVQLFVEIAVGRHVELLLLG